MNELRRLGVEDSRLSVIAHHGGTTTTRTGDGEVTDDHHRSILRGILAAVRWVLAWAWRRSLFPGWDRSLQLVPLPLRQCRKPWELAPQSERSAER